MPVDQLLAWMRPDAKRPPAAIFLMAVDIVLAELSRKDAAREREGEKPRQPNGDKPPPRKGAR